MTQQAFLTLEKSIQKTFDSFHKQKTDYLPMMFNVSKSEMSRELHLGFGTVGKMAAWNGTVNYDNFSEGYEKEYRHAKYSNGLQLERELYEDNQFQTIKARTNALAYGVHKTIQVHAASVLNNAFSSSYTGPDGKALCASDHSITGRTGDDSQSNSGTLALNYTNLNTVLTNMRNYKDDRGDIMDVIGNCVIVGTEHEKTIKQLLGSEKEAYTADNQKNIYKDELTYIVNPYITDDKWFVANKDLMLNGEGLNWFWRRDPRSMERDSDYDSEIYKWKCVGRWSYGWDNWFFIYGNNPA